MSIWLALLLVSLCAILWDAGIILQKLAVDALPPLRLGRGLHLSLRGLLTSGRWMTGLAASAAGWGLFAWALSFTPVSVARAIQGSGFVILALFSMVVLRDRLSTAEWLGVVLVTAGVAALGIAGQAPAHGQGRLEVTSALGGAAACLLACLAAFGLSRALRLLVPPVRIPPVVVVSIAAGILLGLGDVCTRAVLLALRNGGPWLTVGAAALCLVGFYVSGFLVLSRAYQHGRPIVVTAVSDLCARLAAIFMGVTALGERLPSDPGLRALTLAGFCSILSGAVLLSRFGGEGLASQLTRESKQGERPVPPELDAHD
jgi:drug/metabolite transporter (DMT)-like permease